jgi:hypothetical protein
VPAGGGGSTLSTRSDWTARVGRRTGAGGALAEPRPAGPHAPEWIRGEAGAGQVTLSWGAVAGAAGYVVYRASAGGGELTPLDHGGSDVPHASFIALDAAPQEAFANIQALRLHYPGAYGVDGFFYAVNPVTGAVGHRYLVLDQSMIMAALDNALDNRALPRYFAADPVSWAARTYLSLENMGIG